MSKRRAIVWFRNDLRLHDNEALTDALRCAEEVLPVYIFDERIFLGKTHYGFPKTGKHRAKFIIESVADLRNSLSSRNTNLVVRIGKPEELIFDLARQYQANWIFCNRERTQEEVFVQDNLEKKLWSVGLEIRYSRGKMLFYTADLPFPVTHTPDVFTHFRKEVDRIIPIREPLPIPEGPYTKIPADIEAGEIPELEDLGHEPFEADPRAVLDYRGGETAGLHRLKEYIWESGQFAHYKETRNGLLGANFSSKFSAWLAQGCLSPKQIFAEIKRFEEVQVSNESTQWLYFELLWRDFFRLMGKKHGNKIFQKNGFSGGMGLKLRDDETLLHQWIEGQTREPFVDANMRELALTGFMSNRGRQNVASYLVNDLKVNWLMGAEYFESMLIDYDPCSNYGNWNYIAGVGADPKENRYFNITSQAKRYDPLGEYVRLWLPDLKEYVVAEC